MVHDVHLLLVWGKDLKTGSITAQVVHGASKRHSIIYSFYFIGYLILTDQLAVKIFLSSGAELNLDNLDINISVQSNIYLFGM